MRPWPGLLTAQARGEVKQVCGDKYPQGFVSLYAPPLRYLLGSWNISEVGIDQKKISKSLNFEWDFMISELISGFCVRFQIFR